MTVQPAARAGAIFQTAMPNGPFQGLIAATTPMGSFNVYDKNITRLRVRDRIAMNGRRLARVVSQQSYRTLLTSPRGSNRPSHVQRIQQGDFIEMPFHQVGEPQQHRLPLKRLETAPRAFKSAPRSGDRAIDVLDIAIGDLRERLTRRGVDAVKSPAAERRDEFSVDQQTLRLAIEKWAYGRAGGFCTNMINSRYFPVFARHDGGGPIPQSRNTAAVVAGPDVAARIRPGVRLNRGAGVGCSIP